MAEEEKSKDPAVLLYTSDFLVGTTTMTNEQKGKYITLLCLQHQQGRLEKEDVFNICSENDTKILKKFQIDENGLYFNRRMENEATKRKAYAESRRRNKKGKVFNNTSSTYDEHMVNEDVNESINKKLDINCSPEIEKVFEIYKTECPKLLPLTGERQSRQSREQIGEFLKELDYDIERFKGICKKANELGVIANNKIDLKSLINNHIGIMNGKYERDNKPQRGVSQEKIKELFSKGAKQ